MTLPEAMTCAEAMTLCDLMTTTEGARTIMALDGTLQGLRRRIPSDILDGDVNDLACLITWLDGASKLAREALALRGPEGASSPSPKGPVSSTGPRP